jgi:tripartite-type tricarboxylate transporter receptor subunit TctC
LIGLAFVAAVASQTLVAQAQDFPNRTITIVVGLAPGGITDVTARLYGEALSKNIGQKVVIENRPGAGGAIGAAAVQNAKPDGYTVLIFSGSQHAAVPALQRAPYEPVKGFAAVSLLFNLVTLLVVPTDSPANSVAELLALGKKKPNGLLFGSPGVGTPSHLLAVKIANATKTPMEYVHYKGGAPMMADLITGRVDFGLASYTAAGSNIEGKKLKAIAIDADKRWAAMPNVPTLEEAGIKEKVASWFAVAAPAGTPPDIVKKLNAEFIKASRDPNLIKRLTDNGTPIVTTTPEQMAKLLSEEVEQTAALVKSLGLK